jgi:hypothetical protein
MRELPNVPNLTHNHLKIKAAFLNFADHKWTIEGLLSAQI